MTTSTLLRTLAATAGFCLAQLAALAQGELRTVPAFERLHASGIVRVELKQGPATEVRVEAEPKALARVRTEVENGTLKIYREKQKGLSINNWKAERVTVYITTPQLSGIEVTGASDVKGLTPITAQDFTIRASGASDVVLQLTAQTLKATASGASDIRLSGRVERQQVHISGSSDYRASELLSQQAEVEASGASDAYVHVSGTLTAHSSGASDVHNKGKGRVAAR